MRESVASSLLQAVLTVLAGARLAALAWLAGVSSAVAAVEAPARKFAEPAVHGALPAPAAGLAQVTLSLVLVLAAVFVAAWLMRRLRSHAGGKSPESAITVLGEHAVGPRERVVLLQVGGERVLVGVASGSVRALHVLQPGTDGAPSGRP